MLLGTSSRVCRHSAWRATSGPTIWFLSQGWIIFFLQDFFRPHLCSGYFVLHKLSLVTIMIYKNFYGSLGCSASTYVMVGPERYHHLRFGAWIFQWSENTRSERLPIEMAQLPFRINREAPSILVYIIYWSSKPLHTEKAGSKGTGMASKVARQE